MPNYCDLQITVQGSPEAIGRFSDCITANIQEDPGNERNEVYVPLNGMFGASGDGDVRRIWLPKGKEVRRANEDNLAHINGWCNWEVPTTWLEEVTRQIPNIVFTVQATIEHELYQSLRVADGKSTLIHEELIPVR